MLQCVIIILTNNYTSRIPREYTMKQVLIIFWMISPLFLTACGQSGSGSAPASTAQRSCSTLEYLGTWYNSNSTTDTIIINNDCTFTGNYCDHAGSFTLPNAATYETELTISQANLNGGCMQPQVVECRIGILTDDRLGIDCGTTNQFVYQRWQ